MSLVPLAVGAGESYSAEADAMPCAMAIVAIVAMVAMVANEMAMAIAVAVVLVPAWARLVHGAWDAAVVPAPGFLV